MKRIKLFLPLVIFVGLGVFLWQGLKHDPSVLSSARIGMSMPDFNLETLTGELETNASLPQQTFLLNVWASWCYACIYEHKGLEALSEKGVPVIGVNYKDKPDEAKKFLHQLGNPYSFVLSDVDGKLAIELGVYGPPETFVISKDRKILYRHVGVVTPNVWVEKLSKYFENA